MARCLLAGDYVLHLVSAACRRGGLWSGNTESETRSKFLSDGW